MDHVVLVVVFSIVALSAFCVYEWHEVKRGDTTGPIVYERECDSDLMRDLRTESRWIE